MREQAIRKNNQIDRKTLQCSRKRNARRRPNRHKPVVGFAPSTALIIPTIPALIPTSLTVTDASARAAKIVLSLFDMGLVSEIDLEGNSFPHELISTVLTRWLDERSRDFKGHFNLYLSMKDTLEEMGMSNEDLESVDVGEDIATHGLKVAVYFRNPGFYTLREKVDALENDVPGLGEHALSMLYSVLHQTQFAVTPCWALDTARYEYWQGEDDEKDVIEEYLMNDEEYDGLTRAEFDEQIPKLASEPGEKLSRAKIARIAKEYPRLAKLCMLLLEGETIRKEYKQFVWSENIFDGGDCHNVEYGCLLSWQEGDPVCRILDDWGNYVYQMGTCDLTGIYFSHDSAEGIADLLRRIDGFLKYLSFGARLLEFLGTKEVA